MYYVIGVLSEGEDFEYYYIHNMSIVAYAAKLPFRYLAYK